MSLLAISTKDECAKDLAAYAQVVIHNKIICSVAHGMASVA